MEKRLTVPGQLSELPSKRNIYVRNLSRGRHRPRLKNASDHAMMTVASWRRHLRSTVGWSITGERPALRPRRSVTCRLIRHSPKPLSKLARVALFVSHDQWSATCRQLVLTHWQVGRSRGAAVIASHVASNLFSSRVDGRQWGGRGAGAHMRRRRAPVACGGPRSAIWARRLVPSSCVRRHWGPLEIAHPRRGYRTGIRGTSVRDRTKRSLVLTG
jgi:hypothetical protein